VDLCQPVLRAVTRAACYPIMMRLALLGVVSLLAGCPVQGNECTVDLECDDGLVCARDHACAATSEVREVKAQWTINGGPASDGCSDRDLYIEFRAQDRNDSLGFSPVPCFTGQFIVDKLPLRFIAVELGVDGGGDVDTATFDADGNAQLDLSL